MGSRVGILRWERLNHAFFVRRKNKGWNGNGPNGDQEMGWDEVTAAIERVR